jgi:hypothetical protein
MFQEKIYIDINKDDELKEETAELILHEETQTMSENLDESSFKLTKQKTPSLKSFN